MFFPGQNIHFEWRCHCSLFHDMYCRGRASALKPCDHPVAPSETLLASAFIGAAEPEQLAAPRRGQRRQGECQALLTEKWLQRRSFRVLRKSGRRRPPPPPTLLTDSVCPGTGTALSVSEQPLCCSVIENCRWPVPLADRLRLAKHPSWSAYD